MNYLSVFFIFFINFILQTTVFRFFEILGVIPNTTLIFVIIFSFLYKERYGMIYGIIFGLMQDVFYGDIIGVASFIYFTIGFVIDEMKRHIYKETVFTPVVITMIGVTYYHLMYWLLMRLFNADIGFFYILRSVYLIEIFYDVAVSIFIYKILFNRYSPMKY